MKAYKTFLEHCYGCHIVGLPWSFIRGCRSDAGITMQAPGKDFASLLDVSGDFDFFIVGLQEAPSFDSKNSIQQTLGDKYWCDSSPLSMLHAKTLVFLHCTGILVVAISGDIYMPEVVCTFLAAFVGLSHLVLVKAFSSVRERVH